MSSATARQAQVLVFIARTIADRGYAPTARELCDALSVQSTNGVNDHLLALERGGFITRESRQEMRRARGIDLTTLGYAAILEHFGPEPLRKSRARFARCVDAIDQALAQPQRQQGAA
jgi:SOS-response transcriptional repressor LexA